MSRSTRALLSLVLAASPAAFSAAARAQEQPAPPPPAALPPPAPPPAAPPPAAPPPGVPPPAVPLAVPDAYAPPPYVPPPYAPPPATPPPFAERTAAAPREEQEPSRTGPSGNWYGWQSLIAIAPFDISMFIGLGTTGTGSTAAFWTGFLGRGVAPGIVHMAHQKWGKAFGSIGLNAGMAATGLVIAYAVGVAETPKCQPLMPCRNQFVSVPPGVVYGAVAGSMSATVLDLVFFAYREKTAPWMVGSAKPAPTWTLAPYLAPAPGGRIAGVTSAGAF